MTPELVLDLIRQGLYTIVLVSAPPLIMGLSAGLLMSIFQTVTSIQEPTLAFVPKILAVLLSLILFGPFMMSALIEYYQFLISNLGEFVVPRL